MTYLRIKGWIQFGLAAVLLIAGAAVGTSPAGPVLVGLGLVTALLSGLHSLARDILELVWAKQGE